MKIAQVAPLMESVPPRFYGGTERIASYLTEELVAQGHDVTLFASGDSITAAKLVPCCAQALRLNKTVRDPIPYYMLMLDKVRRQAHEFDIIHFHMDQFHFPIFRDIAQRTITGRARDARGAESAAGAADSATGRPRETPGAWPNVGTVLTTSKVSDPRNPALMRDLSFRSAPGPRRPPRRWARPGRPPP